MNNGRATYGTTLIEWFIKNMDQKYYQHNDKIYVIVCDSCDCRIGSSFAFPLYFCPNCQSIQKITNHLLDNNLVREEQEKQSNAST